MKTRVVSFIFTITVTASFLVAPLALSAQSKPAQSTQVAAADGKEAVCDGALEIIPSGQMSFARKRYVPAPRKAKTKLTKPRSTTRR
ncbi:MAG TPA: hypothetical protein VFZ34_13815 [Blastocatellia bacterium]|nr:hypothetical protein [Blastocatellia bacterium]